ncbi:MAG: hypothetical protein U0411_00005 [Thermodesulfovibrionales bacterium]
MPADQLPYSLLIFHVVQKRGEGKEEKEKKQQGGDAGQENRGRENIYLFLIRARHFVISYAPTLPAAALPVNPTQTPRRAIAHNVWSERILLRLLRCARNDRRVSSFFLPLSVSLSTFTLCLPSSVRRVVPEAILLLHCASAITCLVVILLVERVLLEILHRLVLDMPGAPRLHDLFRRHLDHLFGTILFSSSSS